MKPTLLVPPEVGRVRYDLGKSVWLWGMAIPGIAFGLPAATPVTVAASLALAFATLCLGHSVGLHRGIIHESYRTRPIVRGALAYLSVLSGLGGPLSWVRTHAVRDHWQNRIDCPPYFAYDHSMARDFVWNLHLRFEPADARADARLPRHVLSDPWLRFLEATWPLHVLGLALVVYVVAGPAAVAVCVCARTAASIVGHWAVCYAAHVWGDQPHEVAGAKENGTNLWIVGVLSFGEGFHNNHHAFPRSARMGMGPMELDLGWMTVWLLEHLRIVRDVRSWHRAPELGSERLLQHHEVKVVAARQAEARIAVRERLARAGAHITTALVERDELVALRDDGHAHDVLVPDIAHQPLGLPEDDLADAGALEGGDDREHAKVTRAVLDGHVGAGHERAVALGEDDDAVRALDASAHVAGVGALPIEEVGLGGPARAAFVAAVRGLDERHDGGDVGEGGGTEADLGGHSVILVVGRAFGTIGHARQGQAPGRARRRPASRDGDRARRAPGRHRGRHPHRGTR
jgi:stearoyl-CoA desaturase (delta-9 desaturase)